MGLLLAVEGGETPPQGLDAQGNIVIDERMTLGQAADNDLVLDDGGDGVAPHHCVIFRDPDGYHIIDHSAGRTFLNEAQAPLGSEGPVTLSIGDSLQMGAFRLTVMGASDMAEGRLERVSLDDDDGADAGAAEPDLLDSVLMAEDQAVYAVRREIESPWDDQPEALFPGQGGLDDDPRDQMRGQSRADHLDPMHHAYVPSTRRAEAIPEDWDFLAEIGQQQPQQQAPAPMPHAPVPPVQPAPRPRPEPEDITLLSPLPDAARPVAQAMPIPAPLPVAPPPRRDDAQADGGRADASQALAAFARAAGLAPEDLPRGSDVQTMELAGRLLSTALSGLHMLMVDCNRLAHSFGLPARGQSGQGDQHNPFGMAGSSRDALRLLMRGNLPGFLPGDIAIAQACADIASQQELALRNMRQACAAIAESLAPEAIAALEPPQGRVARLRTMGVPNTYRRAYERRHREVMRDVAPLAGSSVATGRFAPGKEPGND